MADMTMVARLADLTEFAELVQHFAVERDRAIYKLGQQTFANPEGHERLEWESLKAFYRGVAAVLALPAKERDKLSKA